MPLSEYTLKEFKYLKRLDTRSIAGFLKTGIRERLAFRLEYSVEKTEASEYYGFAGWD